MLFLNPVQCGTKTKKEADWVELLVMKKVQTSDEIHGANADAFGHRYAMCLPPFESCAKWHEKQKTPDWVFFGFSRHAGFEPATYRFVAGHSIH